mgnify:FL=1|tara:strand:- start:673 stop:1185 length:513 start_codon:yes stop_codon:yes gene_type:complete
MDLNKFIEKNDIPFNQNEVQGYLMGLLVCKIGENFKLEFVKFIGKDVYDSLPEKNALDQSIAQTINSLINNSLSLSFDEHANLETQLEGMAHWVTYFILAINIAVDNKYIKNSLQIQELLFDFQEITRSQDNYFIDNEVDDREHYDTIREYILNSVYSIYNFVRENDGKK